MHSWFSYGFSVVHFYFLNVMIRQDIPELTRDPVSGPFLIPGKVGARLENRKSMLPAGFPRKYLSLFAELLIYGVEWNPEGRPSREGPANKRIFRFGCPKLREL